MREKTLLLQHEQDSQGVDPVRMGARPTGGVNPSDVSSAGRPGSASMAAGIEPKLTRSFFDALKTAKDTDELSALMNSVATELGFDAYALVRHLKQFFTRGKGYALHNYPPQWIDYYMANDFWMWDPVLRASQRTAAGFRFADIPSLIELSEQARNVMVECHQRGGISEGFCIPAHVPGEISISCTFIVLHNRPLPVDRLLMAELLGSCACEAARRIMWPRHPGVGPAPGMLTTRQLECVVLVGRGKTDWEIAQLLDIHEETVTGHINEARRRYGVGRRAELPLHAVFRGDLGFGDIFF